MKNFFIKENIYISDFFLLLILRVRGNFNDFNFLNYRTNKVKEKINEWKPRDNTVGLMNNVKILTFQVLIYHPVIDILSRQAYAELELIWIT